MHLSNGMVCGNERGNRNNPKEPKRDGKIPRQAERISQGGRIIRRETKTDRKTEKEKVREKRIRLYPMECLYWLQQCENLNTVNDFFFLINATNTECPDLSDKSPLSPLPSHYRFPTERKWENSILCSHWAYKSFPDHRVFVGTPLQLYWDIVFPFSRMAACVWSQHRHNWTQWEDGKWFKPGAIDKVRHVVVVSHTLHFYLIQLV